MLACVMCPGKTQNRSIPRTATASTRAVLTVKYGCVRADRALDGPLECATTINDH
jgi:hypothetical protein